MVNVLVAVLGSSSLIPWGGAVGGALDVEVSVGADAELAATPPATAHMHARQRKLLTLNDSAVAAAYDAATARKDFPVELYERCNPVSRHDACNRVWFPTLADQEAAKRQAGPMTNREDAGLPVVRLSTEAWIADETEMGLYTCKKSTCVVDRSYTHTADSDVLLLPIQIMRQVVAWPTKVKAGQINAMLHMENSDLYGWGGGPQVLQGLDMLLSHRPPPVQAKHVTHLWQSYLNSPEEAFRAQGLSFHERRPVLPVWISNCKKSQARNQVLQILIDQGLPVVSMGKCFNTAKMEEVFPECMNLTRHSPMVDMQKECAFWHSRGALVLENSAEDDYVTEKLWQPLKHGAVPVYYGTHTFKKMLPVQDAAIYMMDYQKDFPALVREIKRMLYDEAAFLEYNRWRNAPAFNSGFKKAIEHQWGNIFCRACDAFVDPTPSFWDQYKNFGVAWDPKPECTRLPLFYINLDRRPDRDYHMRGEFSREQLEPLFEIVRVSGVVPGDNLTQEERVLFARALEFQKYNKGALMGNALSHLRIWRLLADSSCSHAIVLEDDAVLKRGFVEEARRLIAANPPEAVVTWIGAHSYANGPMSHPWPIEEAYDPDTFSTRLPGSDVVGIMHDDFNPASLGYLLTHRGANQLFWHFTDEGFALHTDHAVREFLKHRGKNFISRAILSTGAPTLGSDISTKFTEEDMLNVIGSLTGALADTPVSWSRVQPILAYLERIMSADIEHASITDFALVNAGHMHMETVFEQAASTLSEQPDHPEALACAKLAGSLRALFAV